MIDYVTGKYPLHTSVHWRTVNTVSNFHITFLCYITFSTHSSDYFLIFQILFPANVNQNHWVAVEVDLNEQIIKVYDSKPDTYSVNEILKWATCLRKMLPSLLVNVMP